MSMQSIEELGRELERQGKADRIRAIAESEDGQKITKMLDANAVESAAKNGDTEALKKLLGQVLNTDEGKRLAENVKKMMTER